MRGQHFQCGTTNSRALSVIVRGWTEQESAEITEVFSVTSVFFCSNGPCQLIAVKSHCETGMLVAYSPRSQIHQGDIVKPTALLFRLSQLPSISLLALMVFSATFTAGRAAVATDEAKQALADTDFRGGLVVHLGCGDGRMTAALHAGDRSIVQGLDSNPNMVADAREHLRELGLYGVVSVDVFDGRHLPYADNLVNLVVQTDDVVLASVKRRPSWANRSIFGVRISPGSAP